MTDAPASECDFPADLIIAQQEAGDAKAKLLRLQGELPWSREPHEGWEAEVPAHGGALQGFKSSRPATGGWSQEQKVEYDAFWEGWREEAAKVYAHSYWGGLSGERAINGRQALKVEAEAARVPEADSVASRQDAFVTTG
ncbi:MULTISPECIES: hypothetical protein [unclassified Streptomyces]|uniref:hypothetical protein n=1 Tax=unclassified Streptomyces TaxID=2593676 RepID=UPI0033BD77CD